MTKILIAAVCLLAPLWTFAQNVGIGTFTPAVRLHVVNNDDELVRLQGEQPYLSFYNGASPIGYAQAYGSDMLFGTFNGNTSGAIRFYNNNINNMTILANGHVGIGINTPGAPLSFPNLLGNKISFWRAGANNDFGIGINSGVMQFYTAGMDKIAFGYGNANPGAFIETITMFTGNGFLGLGTTSPQVKLHVNADNEALRLSGSNNFLSFYNGSTYKGYLWNKATNDIELGTSADNTAGNLHLRVHALDGLTVLNDGRVRVGAIACTSLSQGTLPKLSVFGPLGIKKFEGNDNIAEWAMRVGFPTIDNPNGLVFTYNGGNYKAFLDEFDGSWHQSSDSRLKEDFNNYKPVLDGIKKLDVLTYHYKSDKTGHRSFGLIAQNLKQYFPELVSGDENSNEGFMGIAYGKTGVLAIKAIQEQQTIIEAQQKKIETLEKRLAMIESKLN